MTPLELSIVLHYYTRATDYRDGDFSAPAVRGAMNWMLGSGQLLGPSDGPERKYCLTERGVAYVRALCAMPLPVQQWVTPPTTPAT